MDRGEQRGYYYGFFNGLPRETEERRVEFLSKLKNLLQEYSVDIGADYDGELLISDKHGLFVCGGCLDSEHFDCDKEENRARDIQGPKQYFPENKHACPISTEPFPFNNVIRIANE